jgi:hypothetical protein
MTGCSDLDQLAAYRHWCQTVRSVMSGIRRIQEDLDECAARTEALQAGQQALDFGPGEPGADSQGSARRGG